VGRGRPGLSPFFSPPFPLFVSRGRGKRPGPRRPTIRPPLPFSSLFLPLRPAWAEQEGREKVEIRRDFLPPPSLPPPPLPPPPSPTRSSEYGRQRVICRKYGRGRAPPFLFFSFSPPFRRRRVTGRIEAGCMLFLPHPPFPSLHPSRALIERMESRGFRPLSLPPRWWARNRGARPPLPPLFFPPPWRRLSDADQGERANLIETNLFPFFSPFPPPPPFSASDLHRYRG